MFRAPRGITRHPEGYPAPLPPRTTLFRFSRSSRSCVFRILHIQLFSDKTGHDSSNTHSRPSRSHEDDKSSGRSCFSGILSRSFFSPRQKAAAGPPGPVTTAMSLQSPPLRHLSAHRVFTKWNPHPQSLCFHSFCQYRQAPSSPPDSPAEASKGICSDSDALLRKYPYRSTQ